MKLKIYLSALIIGFSGFVGAQIPKFKSIPTNEEKQYEYKAEAEVDRAGTGELLERLEFWAENGLGENAKIHAYKDEADKNVFHVDVDAILPDAHFSISRVHKNRKLNYSIHFNCEKKNYTYAINEIKYGALESYKKGDIQIEGLLSEMKSPTKMSVEEEVNNYFEGIIASITKFANTDIDDLKNPKSEEIDEGVDEEVENESSIETDEQEQEETLQAPKLEKKSSGKKIEDDKL